MEDKPKRTWKKRILIGLAVLCGLVAVPIIILNIIFSANAVKPERMQPPKELLHVKPAARANPTPDTLKLTSSASPYEAFLAESPNQTAAQLYPKLNDEICTTSVYALFEMDFKKRQPLGPYRNQWLTTHRGTIENIFKLTNAGGWPTISNEQAAATDAKELPRMMVPNFLLTQTMGRVLALECRSRREHGAYAGAAECLQAIETLAQSVSEPGLIHALISIAVKGDEYQELKVWLENPPMPPETALKLRRALEKVPPIDLRPCAELEYRGGRYWLVLMLNGSYRDVVNYRLRGHHYHDIFDLMDGVRNGQSTKAFEDYACASFDAIRIKASADSIVADYDTYYGKMREMLTPGRPIDQESNPEQYLLFSNPEQYLLFSMFGIPNYTEAKTRATVAETRMQLDLAGLDRVIEPTSDTVKRIDPFTNAPLRKSDETSHTLIYSLGPDRVDQHGDVNYDPTNGTLSVGDIFIRLPKK